MRTPTTPLRTEVRVNSNSFRSRQSRHRNGPTSTSNGADRRSPLRLARAAEDAEERVASVRGLHGACGVGASEYRHLRSSRGLCKDGRGEVLETRESRDRKLKS